MPVVRFIQNHLVVSGRKEVGEDHAKEAIPFQTRASKREPTKRTGRTAAARGKFVVVVAVVVKGAGPIFILNLV